MANTREREFRRFFEGRLQSAPDKESIELVSQMEKTFRTVFYAGWDANTIYTLQQVANAK